MWYLIGMPYQFRWPHVSIWAAVALVAPACSKDRPASVEAPTSAALVSAPGAAAPGVASAQNNPAAQPAPAESTVGTARVDEANFSINFAPSGAYEAGKDAQAQIVLEAKPPFHVNDNYPYKFKLKDDPGLVFANAVVGKDNVKLETARATMNVPFKVKDAGKHTLAGQFSFSVCTEDKCLMEKRELALVLEAK